MHEPSVYIAYRLAEHPSGGGNQFLRALAKALESKGRLAETPEEAGVVLFNSYQFPDLVLDAYCRNNKASFVHRIDGPMKLYNSQGDRRDNLTYFLNKSFADATIFQTDWSKQQNLKAGLAQNSNVVIKNGVDKSIFYPKPRDQLNDKPIRLISSSWSDNINKGFDFYRFLDSHLDFSRYQYTFVGNSPFQFKNIEMVPPVSSVKLAEHLRAADVYVTASRNDPCSNSLLEAQACGLRAVAFNHGGHPEIIVDNTLLFDDQQSLMSAIENASKSLGQGIALSSNVESIEQICDRYLEFLASNLRGGRCARLPGAWLAAQLKVYLFYNKAMGKINAVR